MSVTINGTNGLTFNDNTTQATSPFAGGLGFRNRIINGDMRIDQRNNGASFTPVNNTYMLDRWTYYATQASKFTAQQNQGGVTPPAGFTNYMGFTSSSAYSVLATDYFIMSQPIEGLNISDFAWGTASATAITFSFRVYSSLTGTFGGSLQNSAQTRSYAFTYSISVANTWTTVFVTIPGDTAGTWLTTNGVGVRVNFSLGAGSSSSGAAGVWATSTSTNYWSATGATSVVGTNGATFYITGVQLEKGSTATSFDYRPYGTELALCQRYFERANIGNGTIYTLSAIGGTSFSTTVVGHYSYKVTKRASPTVTVTFANVSGGAVSAGTDSVRFSGTATGLPTVNNDFTVDIEL